MNNHLTDSAKKIVRTLKTKGFKGIRFESVIMEDLGRLADFAGDVDAFLTSKRDTAYFIAKPRYPRFDDYSPNEYTTAPEFNQSQFEEDLIAWINDLLGKDVIVNYREGCHEFECIRLTTEYQIKATAKADLGAVLAISPEMFGEYLERLATQHGLSVEQVRELVIQSMQEIPPWED